MATLFIKNMVCNRCIMVVQNELAKLGLAAKDGKLGEVTLEKEPNAEENADLEKAFAPLGVAIIDDKKSRLSENIKTIIVGLVHRQDSESKTSLPGVLSSQLHHDYNYLSNLFYEVGGKTIEKYYIAQR